MKFLRILICFLFMFSMNINFLYSYASCEDPKDEATKELDSDCKKTVCSADNGFKDGCYDPNVDKPCKNGTRQGDICCCVK